MSTTPKQRAASLRNLAKGRDKMNRMIHEAAQAVIDRIFDDANGINLDDQGSILDHVDADICGNALRSPIHRNWLCKLIREGIAGANLDTDYRDDEFEVAA